MAGAAAGFAEGFCAGDGVAKKSGSTAMSARDRGIRDSSDGASEKMETNSKKRG